EAACRADGITALESAVARDQARARGGGSERMIALHARETRRVEDGARERALGALRDATAPGIHQPDYQHSARDGALDRFEPAGKRAIGIRPELRSASGSRRSASGS